MNQTNMPNFLLFQISGVFLRGPSSARPHSNTPLGHLLDEQRPAQLVSGVNVLVGPTGIMDYFHSNILHVNKSLLEMVP